jgi:hypothetical protein
MHVATVPFSYSDPALPIAPGLMTVLVDFLRGAGSRAQAKK